MITLNSSSINLKSKWTTHTSAGCLSKGKYSVGHKEYLLKGNTSANREPLSEVISSRIFKLFRNDVVEYSIANTSSFPEIKSFKYNYLSACEVLPHNIVQFYKYCKSYLIKDFYNAQQGVKIFRELGLDEQKLFEIFLLDALVGNMDRHWNNIDVMFNNQNRLTLAPILDFGASLLFDIPDSLLSVLKAGQVGRDIAKPLASTHFNNVRIAKKLLRVNERCLLPVSSEDIFDIVDNVYEEVNDRKYFSPKRRDIIKQYLSNRYEAYIKPHFIDEDLLPPALKKGR